MPPEITLDPHDWARHRAVLHRAVDDLVDYLAQLRERAPWQAIPDASREALRQPVPRSGIGVDAAWDEVRTHVLPYPFSNIHPRGWGWVNGNGTAGGLLAELVVAAMNSNCWGGQQSAPYVELQVLDWCKSLMGFPASASGLLVSGGSLANIVALTVARDTKAPDTVERGLSGGPALAVYCSTETHSSVDKAVALLGLGRRGLRKIPVNENFEIDINELRSRLAADRKDGLKPIAVIGTAGTVNTGAIDDLGALADLCQAEGLWFHVDGAFGAIAALSERLRPRVSGMERADSLSFDLHKWLHVPIDAGCVLVRDAEAHARASFAPAASYLQPLERGPAAGPTDFSRLGPDLTRSFRALKAWLAFREHGLDTFARLAEQNCTQAEYLAKRLAANPPCVVAAPVALNVVAFRYEPKGLTGQPLDRLNRELLMRLQESGVAVPSGTVLHGRFTLRVALTNHRTRTSDLDMLVDGIVKIGAELTP